MGADQSLGPVGVAGDDGLVDLLVRPIGKLVLRRRAQGDAPLLGQPFDHRLMDGKEDRVARNDCEDVVEADVGGFEAADVADRGLVLGQCRCEQAQVGRRRAARGVAGEPDLEEIARLLEMADAVRLRQHLPGSA